MLGILVIDKPLGITSHDVVNRVRRALGTRRVGHAGTLDPLATGALVVAVGPATRFLQYLPLEPKVYEGTIRFGQTTLTQDREGEVTEERPVPDDLEARLVEVCPDFVGEIQQIPPMYSAVKKAGQPLYAYARRGEDVEREPRTVYLDELSLLGREGPEVRVRVVCSGGTYVRTLAHDLGEAVGCGAHLSGLSRTAVGRFTLDHAVPLEAITPESLIPLHEALPPLRMVPINDAQVRMVREGQDVRVRESFDDRVVALVNPGGHVVAVARPQPGGFLHPDCVLPAEATGDAGV